MLQTKRSKHLERAVNNYLDVVDDVGDFEHETLVDFMLYLLIEYLDKPDEVLKTLTDKYNELNKQ